MEVRGDLEALLYVMTKLGAKFPLVGTWIVLSHPALVQGLTYHAR